MSPQEIENLLKGGLEGSSGVWADLGSGGGGVTSALVKLLGPGAKLISVDADSEKLEKQKQVLEERGQLEQVTFLQKYFTQKLDLPPLDGVLMSNSLHFVENKQEFLQMLRSYLKPGGTFILVEYDTDESNAYVPFPLSFESFKTLAPKCGFETPIQFAITQSRYWNHIYSAKTRAV